MTADDGTPGSARDRTIRSFVLRQGRATDSQKRAFELHWPVYGVDYTGKPVDPAALFPRAGELVAEIGFGNGEQLLYAAEHEPQRNFIGIEVHSPGVGRALNGIAQAGFGNVRVYRHDAVEVLRDEIPDGSLSEIRIYFPDPWHKKRHNKRRLIQPEFVARLVQHLAPGGYLHCATDWEPYAQQMLEVLSAEPRLANTAEGYAPKPAYRPLTKFENRGLKLGHGVWDLVFRRLA